MPPEVQDAVDFFGGGRSWEVRKRREHRWGKCGLVERRLDFSPHRVPTKAVERRLDFSHIGSLLKP